MKQYSIFIFILFSISNLFSQNTFSHIEPPNWWVGMKNPKVQLMLHGANISGYNAEINYPGIKLERTIKTTNPNYLFIDLHISKNAKPGKVQFGFFKNGKKVEHMEWELWERDANSAQRMGFDNSDVLYLITPDRFANGNPENDNMNGMRETASRADKGGRHGGDIEGIRQNLDYLSDMGFTAIWINPVLENNMEKYSYHGYSTTDFYKVDPRFGSNEEYRKLVKEAKRKGIKTIMDMIVNHCGLFHWWAGDLPSEDWYNQWENYTGTNHRKSTVQDPYVASVDKQQYANGWFVPTMPDLNQRNPLMAIYLIQNAIWWVEYSGISGIRMDTYSYSDPQFMADWTRAVMAEYPKFNIVGEEWNENPAIVSYWQKGKKNPDGYTSELPSLCDFPLNFALIKALSEKEDWGTGWLTAYTALAQDFQYADPMNLVIFPDNHDMPRFFAQVGEDENLFKIGIAYVLTMRGIPQLYYGTEIMMSSPPARDDGLIRSDFPGGWADDEKNVLTEKGLTESELSAKRYLQKLLHWRKTATAVQTGELTHFDPKDGVYVYFRYDENQRVMVILNKNEKPYSLDLSRFSEMLDGAGEGHDVISGKTFSMKENIDLPVLGALVLELEL